jgi:hypothetical protein
VVEAPFIGADSEVPMDTAQKTKPSNRSENLSAFKGKGRVPQTSSVRAKAAVGGKTQKLIGLLKRPRGASLDELKTACGWQAHSVRGFLAGTVKKRMGLQLQRSKDQKGVNRYRLGS